MIYVFVCGQSFKSFFTHLSLLSNCLLKTDLTTVGVYCNVWNAVSPGMKSFSCVTYPQHRPNSDFVIGAPLRRTCPREDSFVRRLITSSNAFLPEPFEPKMASTSPLCTTRFTPFNTSAEFLFPLKQSPDTTLEKQSNYYTKLNSHTTLF